MANNDKHLIAARASVRDALLKLNDLGADAILFVIDEDKRMLGSLTDGDLRRGFIRGLSFDATLVEFIQPNPVYVEEDNIQPDQIDQYREKLLKIIPVIDKDRRIVKVLNLRLTRSVLPVDAVIMAGGRGQRLMPLTATVPKPMLKVGGKPIIEHNVDRLKKFGVSSVNISVNYLADVIKDYFGDGSAKEMSIKYVEETVPMGTAGSMSLIEKFEQDVILLMNSDLLTDIDFADFYEAFRTADADMAVAATAYHVDVPYAVLEVDEHNRVTSLREKPRYEYYSNAGIYLIKKAILNMLPKGEYFNITDLMDLILADSAKRLITYPILGYWLDIGRKEEYNRAQEDIQHLHL